MYKFKQNSSKYQYLALHQLFGQYLAVFVVHHDHIKSEFNLKSNDVIPFILKVQIQIKQRFHPIVKFYLYEQNKKSMIFTSWVLVNDPYRQYKIYIKIVLLTVHLKSHHEVRRVCSVVQIWDVR